MRRRISPPANPVALLALCAILALPAFVVPVTVGAQTRRVIAVTVPGVPADYDEGAGLPDGPGDARVDARDDALRALALDFAREVAGILRLATDAPIQRIDFLLPEVDLASATAYYARNDVGRAVFGSVVADPAGVSLAVTVWREGSELVTRRFAGARVDVEQAALDVASIVLGRDLVTGWLEVEGTGGFDSFAVFADGNLLGRNQREIRLLEGSYRITVTVPSVLGDQPVEVFDVEIRSGATARIALEPPDSDETVESTSGSDAQAGDETGVVRVDSTPSGASVLLDDRVLGATPLERLGVPAGRYELRVVAEGFHPVVAAIDVRSDRPAVLSLDLEVDPEDPQIAALLIPPVRGSLAGIGGLALKSAVFVLHGFTVVDGYWTVLAYSSLLYALDAALLATAMPAHALANAPVRSAALAGAASLGIASMITIARIDETTNDASALPDWIPNLSSIGVVGAIVLTGGAHLYDMIAGPAIIERRNRQTLDAIEATGKIPEPDTATTPRFGVEALGGSVARFLYLVPLRENWLRAELGGGAQFTRFDPVGIGVHALARAVARPFPGPVGIPNLEAHVETVVETDFASVGVGLGGGIGTWVRFRSFELYWRHSTRYSIRSGDWSVLIGFGGAF